MAKDEFGNYIAGLQDAGISLPPSGAVFNETDFPIVGGLPQGTPASTTAILIGNDGHEYKWYGNAWH